MRYFLCSSILVISGLITGCKFTTEVSVTMSELMERKNKDIIGDLYVEVPSCNDHRDSRNPSKSVIEARESIPGVFKGARYVECFRKNFDSMAHFKIPMNIRPSLSNLNDLDHISIVFNADNELMVGMPYSLRKRIDDMRKRNLRSVDLIVNINVKNDSGNDFNFMGIAAYFGGRPYTYTEAISKSGNSFLVKLSDVSVSRIMQYGATTVFKKLN